MFSWLREERKGRVEKIGHEYVSYSASAVQLKRFCAKNDIPVLIMHSGRRGGVTVAVEMGMARNVIQAVGSWSSGAETVTTIRWNLEWSSRKDCYEGCR